MRLAVLYWFYRDPALCLGHLRLARMFNRSTPFYGLYGGPRRRAREFERTLGPWLDDFYAFPEPRPARWKWYHGDRMIVDWYLNRGRHLDWDSVVVQQWDTLLCAPLAEHLPALGAGQVLLSGLRPIREVESKWWWTSPRAPHNRDIYLRFRAHVERRYGAIGEPACCLFIVSCLPRAFLEAYATIDQPELGFLEYKLPAYAQIFGLPFCVDHCLAPHWNADATPGDPARAALNAQGFEVPAATIRRELAAPDGARIFHPVRRPFLAMP